MLTKKYNVSDELKVSVEEIAFMPQLKALPDRPFPFIYFISITNFLSESVCIRGRKWIIKQKDGKIYVVEGSGIIQKKPILIQGETFKYNSYHIIGEDAIASGAIFAESSDGEQFCTQIPEFRMNIPVWAI